MRLKTVVPLCGSYILYTYLPTTVSNSDDWIITEAVTLTIPISPLNKIYKTQSDIIVPSYRCALESLTGIIIHNLLPLQPHMTASYCIFPDAAAVTKTGGRVHEGQRTPLRRQCRMESLFLLGQRKK